MTRVLPTARTTVDLAHPEEFERIGEIGVDAYRAVVDLSADYARALRDVTARVADAVVLVAREGRKVLGSLTLAAAGTDHAETALGDELEVRMFTVDPGAPSVVARGRRCSWRRRSGPAGTDVRPWCSR